MSNFGHGPDGYSRMMHDEPRPAPAEILTPEAQCPVCRTRPRLRISRVMQAAVATLPRGTVLQTYQCHHPSCGHIYAITAWAFQEARP